MEPRDNVPDVEPTGDQGVMQTEPVVAIGGITLASVTALVIAIFTLSKAFNLYNISDDQQNAILGVLGSFWTIGPLLIVATRQAVYAPANVRAIKTTLQAEDPNTPASPQAIEALAA